MANFLKDTDDVGKAFDMFGESDSDDEENERSPPAQQPKPQTLLERITLSLSIEEIESKEFSPETISRAVSCIRVYGIVIIQTVFEQNSIISLGEAALQDFQTARNQAVETGIDRSDWKFQELACREEHRYELRQCPELNAELKQCKLPLSDHQGILSILQQACAAPNFTLESTSMIAGDVGVFVSQPGACDQR